MQPKKRPVLKNDSFMERYPKTFGVCFVTLCIGMLFSRPIYDFLSSFELFKREIEFKKKYMSQRERAVEE